MAAEVTLRASRPADRDALVAVWRRAVDATHHFLAAGDVAVYERAVRERHLAALDVTVATEDERVCGFVGVAGDRVEMLFVDPDDHGRGVGSRLLEHVTGLTTALDVNEQNEGAVRFYAARGFVVVGRSETDDEGRPFPLLHLRRVHRDL